MNTPGTATHVFFTEKGKWILDTCTDENPPRSHVNKKTLEDFQKEYPDTKIVTWQEALETLETLHKTEPQRITEETFIEMLEVLPPVGWTSYESCESFKMSERYSGNITDIYARIGNEYYSFRDSIFMTHNEIIQKIAKSKEKSNDIQS